MNKFYNKDVDKKILKSFSEYSKKIQYFYTNNNLQKQFLHAINNTSISSILWPHLFLDKYHQKFHITIDRKITVYPLLDLDHRLACFGIRLHNSKKNKSPDLFAYLLLTVFQLLEIEPVYHREVRPEARRILQRGLRKIDKLKNNLKVPAALKQIKKSSLLQLMVVLKELQRIVTRSAIGLNTISELELDIERLQLQVHRYFQENSVFRSKLEKIAKNKNFQHHTVNIEEELIKMTEQLLDSGLLHKSKKQIHYDEEYHKLQADYQAMCAKNDLLVSQNIELAKHSVKNKAPMLLKSILAELREEVNGVICNTELNDHEIFVKLRSGIEQLTEYRVILGKLFYNIGVIYSRMGFHSRARTEIRAAREMGFTVRNV